MKKIVYFAIVITLLVSGCASATEFPVPVTMVVPSITSTNIPRPTATINLAGSVTPTYTPTAISVLETQVSWDVCDGAREPLYKNDLSPNGEWISIACDPHDPSKFNGAKIVKIGDDIIWDVSFYETYGNKISPDGMKVGEMGVVHWTKDGNYAYLKPYFCCVDAPGDIFFNYFQNTLALYRLDLRTGNVTTTLQPFMEKFFSGYNASLSSSDKYLAYVISSSPRDIYVNNLQSGDSFTIQVDEQYVASGKLSWSHDGNKAVFVAVKQGWDYYNASIDNGVSYFLLDLKTQSSIHLFDKQDIHWVSWTQDGNIILHNVSGTDGLFYNPQDNKFTVVTPTPTP